MATEIPYTLGDYFGVLRRRWAYVAVLLPASVLGAVYLAFTLPPIYRSSATIMLEPSSIPADMIKTTVTAYADAQLDLVRRRVMTSENLLKVVEQIDPYPARSDLNAAAKAALISQNMETQRVDPITLEPLLQSNAFSVFYRNPDPSIAMDVTGRLAEMFLSYNRETRTQQATDTHEFLRAQSDVASKQIVELEHRLADFKTKYGDALPEAQGRNETALDRAERDLDTTQRQILVSREQKNQLDLQLRQLNPNLFDPAGDWRGDLAKLRADLAAAQQKYTPDHPDVRRLRRAIEAMSARTDLTPANTKAPDNPEYIHVASQLDTVNRDLSALEATAARARRQIDTYERSAKMAPEVEREYSQLQRDYQVAQERFHGIEASLSEAALGQVLETQQKGDRLTMIRQPFRPSRPDSPNRLGIILLGFVLGSGLAVGLAALRESSDPTIRSARDLFEITDIKPLAAVPVMLNAADKRHRLFVWAGALGVAAIAILIVGSAVIESIS